MGSHHHKQKLRKRRRKYLRVLSAIVAVVLLFLGTGELFQGSSIIGIVVIGFSSVLLFLAFTIKAK